MEKEFIPYEQALTLKELGFDEPCIRYYWTDGMFSKTYNEPFNFSKRHCEVSAPLYQQAFRWFREKHKLDSYHIEPTKDSHGDRCYGVMGLRTAIFNGRFETYEEAELECLKKLIQITNEKI